MFQKYDCDGILNIKNQIFCWIFAETFQLGKANNYYSV